MDDHAKPPLSDAVALHYDELVTYVARRIGDTGAATEIVHDVFVKLAGDSQAGIGNPRAFLYRVAGNLAIDRLRQQRTRTRYFDGGPLPECEADLVDAETALAAKQRLALLLKAVGELPPRCRDVLVMRKFDGLGNDTIAARLGISRKMVERHLRRALALLLTRLPDEHA